MIKKITRSVSAIFLLGVAPAVFAQSQLEVKCFNNATYDNGVFINGEIVEYGVCSLSPSFYVAVIDPSDCSAWGTNFNGANPNHSFGNENDGPGTPCHQRVEQYFVFEQNDSMQLAGMLNMLQQIPDGHSIIVYAPISYDYSVVNATNSNLIDELSSRWDPSIIQGNSIMVLYGEQGSAASYVTDTNLVDDHITFIRTVCNNVLSVEENTIDNLVLKTEGNTVYLNPSLSIDEITIVDAMGKRVPFVKNENSLTLNQSVSSGMYVFQVVSGKKMYRSKMMLTF